MANAAQMTDDEMLDLVALQAKTDELAHQLVENDVVAVRCTGTDPYWLFMVSGPALIASEDFEDVHGSLFPEGTQYLEGRWLEVEHSKASTGNRHYRKGVPQGDPDLVMSHLVICKAEVTAEQKGRRFLYALEEDEHDSILAHLTEANSPSESESESGSDESEEEEEDEEEEEGAECL
jgi:hypothetical protein